MKRLAGVLVLAALLTACGSSVKLDAPVEDKKGAAVAPSSVPAGGQAAVAPVSTGKSTSDAVMPVGTRIVYFDFDSFVIRPEFQSVIEAHAKFIAADKTRKVFIEGHTDERGGREYNLALGQKRSEAVRRALGLLGVCGCRVDRSCVGKEPPR